VKIFAIKAEKSVDIEIDVNFTVGALLYILRAAGDVVNTITHAAALYAHVLMLQSFLTGFGTCLQDGGGFVVVLDSHSAL
jgi:hypothetical protein